MTVTYAVNDLYRCVQGEGCQTGQSMVLLRLQGCPVGCPWCDTKETWGVDPADRVGTLSGALGASPRWAELDAVALADEVARAAGRIPWVLVTGGEPAGQDLAPLTAALAARGFKTALETSGTATGHVGARFDWVCVSPKIGMPGGLPVLKAAVAPADEIKMVVGRPADVATLDMMLARFGPFRPGMQICLQPVSQSAKATELCTSTVIERGWRLSLQSHKSLGLR